MQESSSLKAAVNAWLNWGGRIVTAAHNGIYFGGGRIGFFHLNKTLEINCCLQSRQCVRGSQSRILSGAKRPQQETPQTDRGQETCKCVKAASFSAPHFTSATLQWREWKSALTARENPKVTPPPLPPAKQRPTPPPCPCSICEIICIHPDAGEVVFPRRLACGFNKFWIACMILRAGEMQTPECCWGHLVPVKHRKQSRTVRAIIQDPGISGTKHPAGPESSVWASWTISKVLQQPPVFHWELFAYYPSTQSGTSERFANTPPPPPAPNLGLVVSLLCLFLRLLAGIQFLGGLGFF